MIRVHFEVTGSNLAALEERALALLDALNGEGRQWKIDYFVHPEAVTAMGDVAFWSAEVEAST